MPAGCGAAGSGGRSAPVPDREVAPGNEEVGDPGQERDEGVRPVERRLGGHTGQAGLDPISTPSHNRRVRAACVRANVRISHPQRREQTATGVPTGPARLCGARTSPAAPAIAIDPRTTRPMARCAGAVRLRAAEDGWLAERCVHEAVGDRVPL
jgi:hypothetical protein